MIAWSVPEDISQDTLAEIAGKLSEDAGNRELQPIEAAALAFSHSGLERALEDAQAAADKAKTPWHEAVVDVLNTVWENDPPQPNGCAECGRSFGPTYTGPCEH